MQCLRECCLLRSRSCLFGFSVNVHATTEYKYSISFSRSYYVFTLRWDQPTHESIEAKTPRSRILKQEVAANYRADFNIERSFNYTKIVLSLLRTL